jgi:phage shock protein PspC (stress-responsive transcriptional regulator)
MDKTIMRVARYIIFCVFIILGIVYLNSAAYSSWASWGPPTDYPKAWGQRALTHFGLSITFFSTAGMALIGLRKGFDWKRSKLKYLWVILVVLGMGYPCMKEWLLVDKCLDSGGAWDTAHFMCRK